MDKYNPLDRQLGDSQVTGTKLAIMSAWNVKQCSDLISAPKQNTLQYRNARTLRVFYLLG